MAPYERMEETIPLNRLESPRTVFEDIPEASQRPDPLRRLTPTPYTAGLPVTGHTVKLETNAFRILEHAVDGFRSIPWIAGRTC